MHIFLKRFGADTDRFAVESDGLPRLETARLGNLDFLLHCRRTLTSFGDLPLSDFNRSAGLGGLHLHGLGLSAGFDELFQGRFSSGTDEGKGKLQIGFFPLKQGNALLHLRHPRSFAPFNLQLTAGTTSGDKGL